MREAWLTFVSFSFTRDASLSQQELPGAQPHQHVSLFPIERPFYAGYTFPDEIQKIVLVRYFATLHFRGPRVSRCGANEQFHVGWLRQETFRSLGR